MKLIGQPPRQGKVASQYTCLSCKLPLIRLSETLFECPACRKKVKAMLASNAPATTGQLKESIHHSPKYLEELMSRHKLEGRRINEKKMSSIDIWVDMSLPIVEADPILFFSSMDVDYSDGGESE